MSGVASNIMVPFMGIDIEAAASGLIPETPIQALIIGQKLSGGTGAVETKYLVSSADEVALLGGIGSMVHKQAQAFFANATNVTAQLIMLADVSGGTQATQALTVTGPATAAGEIALYVNGERIAVSVASGDAVSAIGAAIVAAVNAVEDLPWTAAFSTPTVTLTCDHKGIKAGDIDVRLNYNSGESLPAGVGVAVSTYTAGTSDPDIQDALDVIGDDWFNVVVNPYTDATNVGKWQVFAAAQWGVDVMKDAVAFQCIRDTRANLITLGQTTATYNSKHVCTMAWYKRLESVYEGSAALAGAVAQSLLLDVGKPLHRVPLAGITALASGDRWTMTERNQLGLAGISSMDDTVGPQTYSVITMYLKNGSGVTDTAYQQVVDVFKLMVSRYRFRVQIEATYGRARLADTAQGLKSGISVITPAIGKTEALIWYRGLIEDGLAEDYETFKANVDCRRSTSNPNRLEWILPENLMNSFIVGSGTIQFRL